MGHFNVTVFCFAFILFFLAHGIADYWVQTDWQAQNKATNHKALSNHTNTYQFTFIPFYMAIFFAFPDQTPLWKGFVLPFLIGIPHGLVDNRIFITWFIRKVKKWPEGNTDLEDQFFHQHINFQSMWRLSTLAAVRFHVATELDQRLHYVHLALVAAFVAWRW